VPIQKQIAALDPEMPVDDVLTMRQIIGQSLGNQSFSASLVMAFAVLSLLLASVGLYGVLSYLATQRRSEIGIRIALGAKRERVLRLMLLDGLRPALLGLVLGLVTSVARPSGFALCFMAPRRRSMVFCRCQRNAACGLCAGLPGACLARLAARPDAGFANRISRRNELCDGLQQLRMRMAMLFRRGKAAARLDDELRDHIERQIAENIAAGMSAEESALRSVAGIWEYRARAGTGAQCVELDLA